MSKRIIYQLLPRLWGNSKNLVTPGGTLEENGSGKFSNIDNQTLGYLKDLGVDYLWLTGVLRHALSNPQTKDWVKGQAGSPYSISDCFDVNPYLADNEDKRMEEFEAVIKRAHDSGLKIIIDFVPNHVARDYDSVASANHPVFGAEDDCNAHWKAENDFFYYPSQELRLPIDNQSYIEYPAKASGNSYSPNPGINDWFDTIKLNYCDFHTATWDKMLEVLRFWAGKGVDGFRCDMVELVPEEFFKWLIPALKADYPDLLFVAEIYDKSNYYRYSREIGFDLLYDKSGLYDILFQIIRKNALYPDSPTEQWQSAERITWNWQSIGVLQSKMLNFLENHDEIRTASDFFAQDSSKTLAAWAVSLLMNDSSFMLYFGEEIGERGMDQEGFSGLNGRTSIFDWWSVASLNRLYKEIHGQTALTKEERSLLDKKKELLAYAKLPAFTTGVFYDLCYCNISSEGFDKRRHYTFLRSDGKDTYLVVCNLSPEDALLSIVIPEDAYNWMQIPKTENDTISVSVPAFSPVIIKL